MSEKEQYALAQDKKGDEKALKDDVKPIVFNNIDASTGLPAPLKDTTSLTPMEAVKKQKETETNQKILEHQDKSVVAKVEQMNSSISQADRLIH